MKECPLGGDMTGYTNTPILPEKAKELMSLDTEYKEIITYGKIEE